MNKVLGSVQLNQLDIFQQAFKRALDSHRPLAHLREDLEPAADVRAEHGHPDEQPALGNGFPVD